MSDDLIAFVGACLDDDERDLSPLRQWSDFGPDHTFGRLSHMQGTTALMGARRAFAEIEAKRRILALHAGAHDCTEIVTGTYAADWPEDAPWGKAGEPWAHPSAEHFEEGKPCPTVLALAQPYADRPGWRDEWRV